MIYENDKKNTQATRKLTNFYFSQNTKLRSVRTLKKGKSENI